MTEEEFDSFLQLAMAELQKKQDQLATDFGLGSFSRWWFDQKSETLQFFNQSGSVVLEASIIDIGSYAAISNTWKWAWSNDSILPALRAKADCLKELEDITGYEIFGNDQPIEVDEPMAWELAAIAVKHLGALGCYRAPMTTGPRTFLALMSITRPLH
jgi:hypothetical protein